MSFPHLTPMTWFITPHTLALANVFILVCLITYLGTKITRHQSVLFFEISLVPLIVFSGAQYSLTADFRGGANAIIVATFLTPITLLPLSHYLGRELTIQHRVFWRAFYFGQLVLLGLAAFALFTGGIIEWVTGILDQTIIIVTENWRYAFLNIIGCNIATILILDRTVQHAAGTTREQLKFIYIAYLGVSAYFSYLSGHIFLASYVSQSTLQSGTVVIFCALILLTYSFYRYPIWQVRLSASRKLVCGGLTCAAAVSYLFLSGTVLEFLRWAGPYGTPDLLQVLTFASVALLLGLYISPSFRYNIRNFFATNVFRNKYDYRDLWMKFSDTSSGSLNVRATLPRLAQLIVEAMFVRQVAIWLRSSTSDDFYLVYCHDATRIESGLSTVKLNFRSDADKGKLVLMVPKESDEQTLHQFPVDKIAWLVRSGIDRVAIVEKDAVALALVGVGGQLPPEKFSSEDEQLLTSIANQLGNLILTQKLSDELLLSKEWDSFNRFTSFILHDLKNLATLQGMTLENAKHLSGNLEFTADAFATFQKTTDKMISLIASLSVQRGQLSLKQQPVNILEILSTTFDDLKIGQRNGIKVHTQFPPLNNPPIISGDPELLKKAFTNLLLNAIQSLPHGEGAVKVSVSQRTPGKVTAAIRDTGCGIPPEKLQNLFRPFQSTKEKGMGIGLCHTRSIIEVHGGQIRIESAVNAGTEVEIEFPIM